MLTTVDFTVQGEGVRWDFPGGPVVKTLRFHGGGLGLIPGQGTKILHAVQRGQ